MQCFDAITNTSKPFHSDHFILQSNVSIFHTREWYWLEHNFIALRRDFSLLNVKMMLLTALGSIYLYVSQHLLQEVKPGITVNSLAFSSFILDEKPNTFQHWAEARVLELGWTRLCCWSWSNDRFTLADEYAREVRDDIARDTLVREELGETCSISTEKISSVRSNMTRQFMTAV
jgi:hypothetical protein